MLADPQVADGIYPFCDRRDPAAFLFERADLDLRTILSGPTVAGAVGLWRDELLIFVAPALHGRGIGRASLVRYLNDLTRTGLPVVVASAARGNVASRRLLLSAGFAECGLRHPPRAREPLVDFRLWLTQWRPLAA